MEQPNPSAIFFLDYFQHEANVGLNYENMDNYTKLEKNFKDTFKGIPIRTNNGGPSFFHYWYFMSWEKNLLDLKNLIFGNFKEDLKDKINKMVHVDENSF